MDWLQDHTWEGFSSYFVKNLTIVNDPAERGVGLVKESIGTFQNEKSCQENLLAVSKHTSVVKKDSKKDCLAKIGLV